jgi:site-specific DNA recombinase
MAIPANRASAKKSRKYDAIYVRKSLDRQEQSLPAQKRLINTFLDSQKRSNPRRTYEDILSGTRANRDDYQQMLADAQAGLIESVTFHKINRFGRNSVEGLAAIEMLKKLGIKIWIVDMPGLDVYEPESMFVFSVLMAQGQYFIDDLSEESKKGMLEKAREGGWPFRAPDGYRNVREEQPGGKRRAWLEIDRRRAPIIRMIFVWYATGTMTLSTISDRLNHLHEKRIALGKSGCLRRSEKPWDDQSIYRLLRNQLYAGEIIIPSWNERAQGKHQPIISRRIFDRVQDMLKKHGINRGQAHAYLLQGRVYLESNSATALYSTEARRRINRYRYYYFYNQDRKRKYFRASAIENDVVERLAVLLSCLGDHPVETLRSRFATGLAQVRNETQRKLEAILIQKNQVFDLALRKIFDDAYIVEKKEQLEADEMQLRLALQRIELQQESQNDVLAELSQAITAFQSWDRLLLEEQHNLLQHFINSVFVDNEGNVIRLELQPIWELYGLHRH